MKRKFIDFDDPDKVAAFSSKNGVDVSTITYCSTKIFIFECSTCGNDFKRSASAITGNGSWCPCCNSKHICKTVDCDVCYKKSFEYLYPDKARCWSDKNDFGPESITRGSTKKAWFNCDKCPHSFEELICDIARGIMWCRYCCGSILCADTHECTNCYQKTFAYVYPEKAVCWSSLNDKPSHQVFATANRKIWLNCNVCPHSFEMTLYNLKKGNWCKYCANKVLCENEDCGDCYSKSLEAKLPTGQIIWSPKNKMTIKQVFANSNKKAYFQCITCKHEFKSVIKNVTNGTRCPVCRPNRNMNAIVYELRKYEGVTFQAEEILRYKDRIFYWDMTVTTKWGIFRIESDGPQHFSAEGQLYISHSDDKTGEIKFKGQRERDLLKEEYINTNNLLLFRVSYRQLENMGNLIKDMMTLVENDMKGVGYTDSLYDDWVSNE